MKKLAFSIVLGACLLGAAPDPARAGAKIEIDENAKLDLGIRVQPLVILTESDLNEDGRHESTQDFKVRRARFRLKADVTEWMEAFIQTEMLADGTAPASDNRVIDAHLSLKPTPNVRLVLGQHMAPASRQNLTSSGAMMAIDRPGINYKTLTWGTRSATRFATKSFSDCDAGLRGGVDVRDTGATLFGRRSLTDTLHVKGYAGTYNGVQSDTTDDLRLTARGQVNLFDAEPKFFQSSTYLGKKKTVGIGAAYDTQANVEGDAVQGTYDYGFYTADLFVDWPVGPGTVTFETAYENLDLGDGRPTTFEDGTLSSKDPMQSQGDGYYVQAGYHWNKWQPWVEYESWSSDADTGKGSYDLYRIGVSYFILGHNANIKLGYEQVKADAPLDGTEEDTINTVVLGTYLTY